MIHWTEILLRLIQVELEWTPYHLKWTPSIRHQQSNVNWEECNQLALQLVAQFNQWDLPDDTDGGRGSRILHISGSGNSSASPDGVTGASGVSDAAGTTGTGVAGGRGWLIQHSPTHLQQRPTVAL